MSPKDKKFVNPLLRSTEMPTESSTQMETKASLDTTTSTPTPLPTEMPTGAATEAASLAGTQTSTFTSTDGDEDYAVERRKRGKQAFEKTHDRWTLWVRKRQKRAIKQLAKEQEISYVALLEEAIDLLLKKYGK